MSKTIVALFNTIQDAEGIARRFQQQGFSTKDISIVVKHQEEKTNDRNPMMGDMGLSMREVYPEETRTDDVSDGILAGGVLGGIAGLLIGAGTMMIPGVGLIAAAGPLAGLLSGAVTGGVVGGLVDLGIPEEGGKKYEEEVKKGKVLFTIKVDDDKLEEVTKILKESGALQVSKY